MNNTRFATSIHILTLLSKSNCELLSSEYIAGSININPAIVRKEIMNLKEHHLVGSREGKGGGTFLTKPAEKIRLSDIYLAIRQSSLLGRSNHPNPDCPVGRQINDEIENISQVAEMATIKQLGKTTLAQFSKQFG